MEILIKLRGYLSEVCCGRIPIDAINAIASVVRSGCSQLDARNVKPSPQSVAADLWYGQSPIIKRLVEGFGSVWNGFMSINHFGCYCGIGSGKEGLGIFEMEIFEGKKPLMTFVPPPVHPELQERFMGLDRIGIKPTTSPPLPFAGEGFVPLSSGLWGIGALEFRLKEGPGFDPEALEFVTVDLCDIGIGEECLAIGLAYNGNEIPGIPSPGPSREPYPAVWYSAWEKRWLDLGEASIF